MFKTKPADDKKTKDDPKKDAPADSGWRETVESIAMAVILALLFRGFVAEAFVIPTGSMAPTLMGRHKDVQCPKCSHWYQTGASDEQRDERLTGDHVVSTTCPICRYTQTLNPLEQPNHGSFSGDRIIVGKFAYDLTEPKRWDVIVFKYPGNAVQNYIKRLIGLPGEQLLISGGNIYTGPPESPVSDLQIARKPPHKLDALLQLVDDSDYIAPELTAVGWPMRWQEEGRESAWKAENGGKAFTCDGKQPREAWLRYRHLIPSHDDWLLIDVSKQLPTGASARPGRLITDFYAYDTPTYKPSDSIKSWNPLWWSYPTPTGLPQQAGPGTPPKAVAQGQHWVDDLAVECLAEVTGSEGELALLLVRGGVKHICRINLKDGQAVLSQTDTGGEPIDFVSDDGRTTSRTPKAETSVRGPGKYRLRLTNCDHETLLWVNGSVVKFDGPTTYDSGHIIDPHFSAGDPGDMEPAGIGSTGAAVKVSSLRIYRDKYYIASDFSVFDQHVYGHNDSNDYDERILIPDKPMVGEPDAIQLIFSDPTLWTQPTNLFGPKDSRRYVEIKLQKDQFLPMGDNSPQSSDGRFWNDRKEVRRGEYEDVPHQFVERDLLIGKALLIYWPHTWNRPIPLQPNVSGMGRIR